MSKHSHSSKSKSSKSSCGGCYCKKTNKKSPQLGEYHLRDNRLNVLGYYYTINPCTGRTCSTLDAGGYHYAF